MTSKHRALFLLISLIGSVSSLGIWWYWNQLMYIVGTSEFNIIAPQVIGVIVLLLFQASLIGIVGVLYAPSWFVGLYVLWGVPFLFFNDQQLIGIIWLAMMACSLLTVHILIQRSIRLFIKPVLYRILPSTLKWWFFFMSVILSGSLILNPHIQRENLNIHIPDTIWSNVWEFIGVQIPEFPEQQQYMEAAQSIDRSQLSFEQRALLDEYLIYAESDPETISGSLKQEVESMLNETFDPIRNYWVYIIAVSFFLSAQLVTPLLSIGAFLLVEVVLFLLLKLQVIHLKVEDAQITRYVLG